MANFKEKGKKFDSKKEELCLVNKCMVESCARAMMYGEKKYGRDNYKAGLKYSRIISALLRHTYEYNERHDCDSESGLSHLDHMAACINMLCYMAKHHPELDDRYKEE